MHFTTDYTDEHGWGKAADHKADSGPEQGAISGGCIIPSIGVEAFIRSIRVIRGQTVFASIFPVKLRKFILGFYAALFVAVTLLAANFFVEMERELTTLHRQERASLERLAEAEARLQAQEKYLDQLRHDPALVERLIRQKLGYVRSQEFVFRFEAGLESSRP